MCRIDVSQAHLFTKNIQLRLHCLPAANLGLRGTTIKFVLTQERSPRSTSRSTVCSYLLSLGWKERDRRGLRRACLSPLRDSTEIWNHCRFFVPTGLKFTGSDKSTGASVVAFQFERRVCHKRKNVARALALISNQITCVRC